MSAPGSGIATSGSATGDTSPAPPIARAPLSASSASARLRSASGAVASKETSTFQPRWDALATSPAITPRSTVAFTGAIFARGSAKISVSPLRATRCGCACSRTFAVSMKKYGIGSDAVLPDGGTAVSV